ncbi:MAG: UbiA family prenyltransferase [Candidatus Methanofastidiosa archaeon]|nr:UbiA family prenyltransferase [Candidatus Methanofastidiosa archaeon]
MRNTMKFRALIYNSVTLNAPKNILQLLFGVVIYASITGEYNILKIIFATLGLCLGLGAIYLFNDLTDYESDKKNELKISWKAIANVSLSLETAKYLIVVLSIFGTIFSFLAGTNFFIIYMFVIILNLMYSTPAIRLKNSKNASVIIITLIQILKFSSGWFMFTNSFDGFPFSFVMCLSIGYTLLFL